MYAGLVCQVKVNGMIGAELQSNVGVKQGCPLSPTLFGVFLDGVASQALGAGPALSSGHRVPLLLQLCK